MMTTLVLKLLRDLRVPLLGTGLLLLAFQTLWAKVTERITAQLLPMLLWLGAGRGVGVKQIEEVLFAGPGKVMRTLMGGEQVSMFRTLDMLTIGYVHPVMLTLFCVWAVGRSSGAIAGELDRGTMELLVAQPVPRYRLILAHLLVDLLTIPILCGCLLTGNWLGIRLVDAREAPEPTAAVQAPEAGPPTNKPERTGSPIAPSRFAPALANVAALIFAVSGVTLAMSAMGRFRWRVLGAAVFATLLQFLVNAIGQLWDAVAFLRPFTVFYYYQPQQIILNGRWTVDPGAVWNDGASLVALPVVVVLVAVGAAGYLTALWAFGRRDLPAPL